MIAAIGEKCALTEAAIIDIHPGQNSPSPDEKRRIGRL
jgi:hypothetical protein